MGDNVIVPYLMRYFGDGVLSSRGIDVDLLGLLFLFAHFGFLKKTCGLHKTIVQKKRVYRGKNYAKM